MKKIFSLILAITILSLVAAPLLAQEEEIEATPVPSEEINENIKERLKRVAGEQSQGVGVNRKQAVAGDLQSIANDTLTIRADSDIRLASVSGETVYVSFEDADTLDLEDLVIGDYVVALGFMNGSEVLDTRRVLQYEERPEPIAKKSFFGYIESVDEDEETITILSPTGESLTFYISSDSLIETKVGENVEEVDLTDLDLGQTVALVYLVDEDGDNELLSLLAIPPSVEMVLNLEATDSAKIDDDVIDGTGEETNTVPAELGQ